MSDLQPRPGGRLSRRQREQRAFALVVATGAFGVLAVVAFVLAVLGAVSFGWVVLLALLMALSGYGFRRSVS
jgi:hypothetical protein